MDKIIWKSFKLGDLFELSTEHCIKKPLKELIISDIKKENYIGIVNASKYNNGIIGYCEDSSDFDNYRQKDILTLASDGSSNGCCFYQKDYIISTGSNKYLKINDSAFKDILDLNKNCYIFISKILTQIFRKSNLFDFGHKLNNLNFSRELILLPCTEVQSTDEYIWEENNKYWTLATDYITELLEKANNKKSENKNNYYQIKLKEANANKIKYESELNEFLKSYEKKSIIWKSFKLGDLFNKAMPPTTNTPAKKLSIFNKNDNGTKIALITRAEKNNGIKGYIEKENFSTMKNAITFNDQFSVFLYHPYEFTTIKDHLSILEPKNDFLKELLFKNTSSNIFLVKCLNKVYTKKLFGFNYTGVGFKFDRELILLPCIEVQSTDEYIWEENNKYWTLAVDYIKYLDLKSKIKKEENKIKDYRNNL